MSDQLNNSAVAIETSEGPSQDWLDAHRTTAEQMETAKWVEGRDQDIAARSALRQTLGQDYEQYRRQLESLSSDERQALVDKSAEDIAAHLEFRAETERDRKKAEEEAAAEIENAKESQFIETPHLREVRQSMKKAYDAAASLDKQIAELQQLNEMRDDLAHSGWDDLPAEQWAAAREGKMGDFNAEIGNLVQQKQAALAEAALHQSAYHEGSRAVRPHPSQPVVDNRPIGQVPGPNGQPMQISRADLATMLQLERDEAAHTQRIAEARKRYPDFEQAGRKAIAAGVDISPQQAAFVRTLPNSADVAYYLVSHPDETRALARMPSHEATRALINISHKAYTPTASQAAPKTTAAPKPPSPVGGSSSRAFDVTDESTSADEWLRGRNADLRRRGKY